MVVFKYTLAKHGTLKVAACTSRSSVRGLSFCLAVRMSHKCTNVMVRNHQRNITRLKNSKSVAAIL